MAELPDMGWDDSRVRAVGKQAFADVARAMNQHDERGVRLANAGIIERYLDCGFVHPDCVGRAYSTIRNLERA